MQQWQGLFREQIEFSQIQNMGKRVLRVCRHFHENRCSSLQRKTQNKRNKLQEIITTIESGHIKHVCCLSKTVFERLTDDVGFWIAEKNGKQGEKVQKQTSKQDKVCLFFFLIREVVTLRAIINIKNYIKI